MERAFDVAWKFFTLGRPVIPSGGGPKKKKALVPWKQYQARMPREGELLDWEKRLHPRIWAMVTGPAARLFVIDADTEAATKRMEEAGLKPHVKTTQGAHYYCQYPSYPISNSTKKVEGFDVRGTGGYVNFAGSNAKAHYEVLLYPSNDNLYAIEQLPAELQELLKPKPIKAQHPQHSSTSEEGPKKTRQYERDDEFNQLAVAEALEHCAYLGHADRDAATLSRNEWWSMIQVLAAFGKSGEEAIHRLSVPYPGYSEEETDEYIRNARKSFEEGFGPHTCEFIQRDLGFSCPDGCIAKRLGTISPAGLASKLAAKAKQPTYPTVKETPPEECLPLPALPEGAWYGLFADYRELVGETTEAPDSYHFASFALVKGAVLGRRLHVYHARRLYPNFYICLVGRTALSRKDTAWSRGRGILLKLHDETDVADPIFQIIPGIGSAEGLIDALGGVRKVVVLNESELLALMNKAKQESLSNLIPKLTALYDCPDRETLKTRQKAVEAREPFVSIISGSTQAWLQTALTKREIYGGFANRFMFISGEYKEPMPFPPKVDAKKQDALIARLNDVRSWAQEVYEATGGELHVPPVTKERFSLYYGDYYRRCASETLSAALIPRVQDFVWKLALLYAAMDLSDSILVPHLEAGIAAGNFLERSALHIFQDFGADKNRENENQLLQYLRSSQNGAVPWRDAYRALHMSAGEFEKIVQPLMRLGIVQSLIAKNDKNQRVKVIRLSTD